jgi:membrane protein DedA with SNARE-associated domain
MMSDQLLIDITTYGYWSILALVFLQEVGVPNPIPNELVLLFSGYLVHTGSLKLTTVILSAVVGDLLAALILFEVFYFFGGLLFTKKPKWLPLPWKKLERLSLKMTKNGKTGTFIGRLTPFVKGYVSVFSGLIRLPQQQYGLIAVSTSIIWASAYVCCGYLIGPEVTQLIHP